MTDAQIITIVSETISSAEAAGESWIDTLDVALADAGVALADEQPDGRDPYEIVYLRDGRTVYVDRDSYAIEQDEARAERTVPAAGAQTTIPVCWTDLDGDII